MRDAWLEGVRIGATEEMEHVRAEHEEGGHEEVISIRVTGLKFPELPEVASVDRTVPLLFHRPLHEVA